MDAGVIAVYGGLSTIFWLVLQRTDRGKRTIVLLSLGLIVILMRNLAVYRGYEGEAWTGVIIGSILAFLFWILIGRYNPPRSTDTTIQVIGLDD